MDVIRVENLSKLYDLGQVGTGTVSKDLNRWLARMRGKADPYARMGQVNDRTKKGGPNASVWALKDINFSVKQGEVIGIIGRNGAGKSTLLKIISRITTPTTGAVKVKGRIASLLEVGTGFHPEMTGRENIFMNGTLLGMTRKEVQSKLDEILDFAGVALYVDTPVKRYSSGMMVRLGFAVAAFLEPEILIVDEVLAVGDAEFQKKAIGRMQEVSKGDGRTVLFVSHSMGSIVQLCRSAILLRNGTIETHGVVNKVVDHYVTSNRSAAAFLLKEGIGDENLFTRVMMTDEVASVRSDYKFDESIMVRVGLYLPDFNDRLELAMRLVDKNQRGVFTIHERIGPFYKGDPEINFLIEIPELFLTPGSYSWIVCINDPGSSLYDLQTDIAHFSVMETGSIFSRYEGADYGSVYPSYRIKETQKTTTN